MLSPRDAELASWKVCEPDRSARLALRVDRVVESAELSGDPAHHGLAKQTEGEFDTANALRDVCGSMASRMKTSIDLLDELLISGS